LESPFPQGIPIFSKENELILPRENENPLEKRGFQTSPKIECRNILLERNMKKKEQEQRSQIYQEVKLASR
jgi:hypothetical protein